MKHGMKPAVKKGAFGGGQGDRRMHPDALRQ